MNKSGKVKLGDLPPVMSKMNPFSEMLTEDEVKFILSESSADLSEEIEFESFLRVSIYLPILVYVWISVLF